MQKVNVDVNERVQIIAEEGLGEVIGREEALDIAYEEGLDLVEMSSKEGISICKLLDYQKYEYDRKKARRDASKGGSKGLKEIRFGSNIGDHDLQIRANNTLRLVKGGHKVKVTLQIRGRNREALIGVGKELMERYKGMLDESIEVEKEVKVEGHNIVMYLKAQ